MTTTEVAQFSGASRRMLQWWDEKGYLRPKRSQGRRRVYSEAQAECARLWVQTRKHVRFRFGSSMDRAVRSHRGQVVVLKRGHYKVMGDTLVIAKW